MNYKIFLMASLFASQCSYAIRDAQDSNSCSTSCGAFDVRIQAGAEPLVWRDRGGIFGENAIQDGVRLNPFMPMITPETVVTQGQCIPKFSTFFKTPWTVGGQIGYTWRDCTRFFLEANYAQAQAKNPCKTILPVFASTGAPAGTTLNFVLSKYRFADGYIGAQYYLGFVCNVGIFLGAKIGFIRHFKSNFSLTEYLPLQPPVILDLVPACPKTAFIESNTSFAGGGLFGFDYCVCNNLVLAVTGEVVANRGPKTNCNIPVNIQGIPTMRIFFGQIKTELRFPITASLRYNF